MPISIFPLLIPNLSIRSWQNSCILLISDPYYFKSTQITQCLLQNSHLYLFVHEMALKYLATANTCPKGITLFYNILQAKTTFIKLPPIVKWKHAIGCSFSDSQWLAALTSSNLWKLIYKCSL